MASKTSLFINLLVHILTYVLPCHGFLNTIQFHHIIHAQQQQQQQEKRFSLQTLEMGFFDAFNKAFANEQFSSPPEGMKANARHILVKTLDDVDIVMNELKDGVDFTTVARRYSTCPSSSQGGSLGSFSPGTMVAEFDKVVFSPDTQIGQIVGPVMTQFGYHLIVVDKRTGV